MSTVYVLKLEHDKYYVGSTGQLEVRINSHLSGSGALWTRMHKPIEVIAIYRGCDEFDEDKYVKKYMQHYGIDNVRGGSYVLPRLDANTKTFIERELLHGARACFKCGKLGHFIKDCPLKTSPDAKVVTALPTDIKWGDTSILSGEDTHASSPPAPPSSPPSPVQPEFVMAPILRPAASPFPSLFKCEKCGASGHSADNCYQEMASGVTAVSNPSTLPSEACNVRVFNTPINNVPIVPPTPNMPPLIVKESSFRGEEQETTTGSEEHTEETSSPAVKKDNSPKGDCSLM